ncbi:DUF255 domain-containing protein [Luteolibacter luteus]|nr:DUF255 domain-containing protein [Luteolibacter luteus]
MLKYGTYACLAAALALIPACRKREAASDKHAATPQIAAELSTNAMQAGPQGFLSSRAGSPVHWQHWDPAVLQRARAARRLVFAFIGAAQYPGCLESLDAIDKDPSLVAKLNQDFVPVLVDIDLCREAGVAAGVMSQELKQPVSFPFILVLSPDANEVTWRPIAYSQGADLRQMFEGATDVISRMWAESPDYVEANSKRDHDNRMKRLPVADTSPANPEERNAMMMRTTRKLANLYDEDIKSVFGTGGLLPLGLMQCLASTSLDPNTPPDIARRCSAAVKAFSGAVLNSAMVDPLDGGIYSSRRGSSWDLPMINRTCMTQARAARALATIYNATKEPRSLDVALGAIHFAEEQFEAQNGLFAAQRLPGLTPMGDWLWTQEQLEQALTPEEATLWKAISGIKAMGNLALEADPKREFFRLNSLGFRVPLAQAAADLNLSTEAAAGLLESSRKKLSKARQSRVPDRAPATAASAGTSFRMVSAYAAMFTATGKPEWRDKALSLAERSRQTFAKGVLLVEQNPGTPDAVCDARAFTYALAIQAALDLAEITMDENWRLWAGDLCSTMSELFVDESGRLLEARQVSTPLALPLEDRIMLFDDSTAGVMRMNIARLEALGQSPPPTLAPWLSSLPKFEDFPVVFTDSILAASFAASRVIVEIPENASPEWREAACRLPLDRVARRFGKEPAARILQPDGSKIPVTSPESLAASIATASN